MSEGYDISVAGAGQGRSPFLSIQNNRKPEQIVQFVRVEIDGHFETEGLRELFGLSEIRVEATDVFRSFEEITGVLSFLLDTMSEAQDLNLPYAYAPEFQLNGQVYRLEEEEGYRVLRLGGEAAQP